MSRRVTISSVSLAPFRPPGRTGYPEMVDGVIGHLDEQLGRVLPDRPDLVVLPEACDRPEGLTRGERADYYRARGDRVLDRCRETAVARRCYIAYSAVMEDGDGRWRNSTRIIDRQGGIAGTYSKNHLVIEENTVCGLEYGREAELIRCDFGTVACAICFDLNFDRLRLRYAALKPDLVIFCSMYHGGLMQACWAYSCRAHFVSAIGGNTPGAVISPVGREIASTTNYFSTVTASVNLDCLVVHLDYNREKLEAMKRKYGPGVTIDDPGRLGSVLVSSNMDGLAAGELAAEFRLELLDDYFRRALAHREGALAAGGGGREGGSGEEK